MPWTNRDIEFNTTLAKLKIEGTIKNLSDLKKDSKRTIRLRVNECKCCFYLEQSVVLHKITKYTCIACDKEKAHGNSRPPKICRDCAVTHNICKECGGYMD